MIKQFTVSPPGSEFNDIVINEIMYAPTSPEPEWIELFNRTSSPISLKNWKLSDASTTITITTQEIFIPASAFVVISKDSSVLNYYNVPSQIIVASIPSLNNTGDAVVLKDFNGTLIDSVSYLPIWGGNVNGKSLERVSPEEFSNDPTNWKTSESVFKATPGTFNSITQKDYDLLVENILYSPEFPLLGNSVNISGVVKNIGKNAALFSLYLYEDTTSIQFPICLLNQFQI